MLTGLPGFVLRDLREGEDHLLLDAIGLVRPLLNIAAILHDVGEQQHERERDDAQHGIVDDEQEQPERAAP